MILLIDNHDSFTYNLWQALSVLGGEVQVVKNNAVSCTQISEWKPTHIVISPGPGNPNQAGVTLEVVRTFAGKIPILGVCLGHQAIVQSFGGRISRCKTIFHGKPSLIHHEGGILFQGVADPFIATRYHSLVADSKTIPEVLCVTAWTADGVVMAVEHKTLPVFGVQFHPESVLTTEGNKILKNFIQSN